MRTRLFIAAVLLAGGPVSGCAFGDRHIELGYPPPAEEDAQAAEAAPARGVVHVGPFDDARSDTTVVGTVRNGFGMETAKVVAEADVTEWVRDALAWELEAAGYTAVKGVDAPADEMALSGDVLRAYCDMYFSYDGQVVLRIDVRKHGQTVLDQSYSGRGSVGTAWAGTADSFSQSLSLALRDALRQFVADLTSREL